MEEKKKRVRQEPQGRGIEGGPGRAEEVPKVVGKWETPRVDEEALQKKRSPGSELTQEEALQKRARAERETGVTLVRKKQASPKFPRTPGVASRTWSPRKNPDAPKLGEKR